MPHPGQANVAVNRVAVSYTVWPKFIVHVEEEWPFEIEYEPMPVRVYYCVAWLPKGAGRSAPTPDYLTFQPPCSFENS